MAIEMVVPAVGESITEVTLASWLKQDGDFVEMDEVIAELESDKATFELTAEKAGVLKRVAAEGDTLPIGAVVCSIEEGEGNGNATPAPVGAATGTETPAKEEQKETEKLAEADKPGVSGTGYAAGTPSPAAQKILSEKNIGTDAVQGTGPGGRITKGDALAAQPTAKAAAKTAETVVNTDTTTPTAQFGGQRIERREKMSALRKTVAKRLVAVKNETAMLTTFNEVNMKPIMDLRAKYKDQFKEKYSVGLGFMSFFTKAVTEALKDFPAVNARIEGDQIVFNEFVDVSIAVSAPKGLVVPVLRNAESMSLAQIEKNILLLATRARENKLSLEEMQGGTFTITNGGVFGSMMSTPIINSPQSAILGMHNIVERPIAENGQVVIRPMMYIALSYDHRIIDGRESVGFLVKVKQYLEDPARLLLGI